MFSLLTDTDFLIQVCQWPIFFEAENYAECCLNAPPLLYMLTDHVKFCLLKENDNKIAWKLYSSAVCL